MLAETYLDLKDELKLYLANTSLLRVASIKISLDKEFANFYDVTKEELNFGKDKSRSFYLKNPSQDTRVKFEKFLTNRGFHFVQNNPSILEPNTKYSSADTVFSKSFNYLVSMNPDLVDRVLNKSSSPLDIMGLLGWPATDAIYLNKIIDGTVVDNNYLLVNFAKAKKFNLDVPNWSPYLFFTPYKFDVTRQEYSESAEHICSKYRDFVRQNNPNLAKRVESAFLLEEFPFSWRKLKSKHYLIEYNLGKVNKIKKNKLLEKIN